jgi:IS5 family transposase
MRDVQNIQMQVGEVDISQIQFNPKSRDDIPKILRGLQHLYMDAGLREKLFELLEKEIAPKVDKRNGRPGMTLWNIFVCGVLRLDLNEDYDRLLELMNHHDTVRQMLGHGVFNDTCYELQTVERNVRLLTPELLDTINQLVVSAGHDLVKKKEGEALRGRSDSFVVKTDVHFPTDISLLFDAMRKTITLLADLCNRHGMSDWRQSAYNIRQVKRTMRSAQNAKRGKAKSEDKKEEREASIKKAHQAYLDVAQSYLDKAQVTLATLESQGLTEKKDVDQKREIRNFMDHAVRQIDQTKRRVVQGEAIPHAEKVFSIFEPHTEWISKGKPGVPVELGVKVCIVEDQYQFILHHQVMERKTDDQVAVSIVKETKERFADLNAVSFDKGFHSPENQTMLKALLEQVVLPRKGKLSQQAQIDEHTEAFIKARRRHSAVESAINALGVHGLDMCPDHGMDGFKRYVALAVVARNIHRIGDILKQREQKREQRKKNRSDRDTPFKLAA